MKDFKDFKVAVDVAWNDRAISGDENTAEAVELQETAPRRVRRSPMCHIVARRVQFGTALVHSMDGITASQWTCGALARDTEKANSYQQNAKNLFEERFKAEKVYQALMNHLVMVQLQFQPHDPKKLSI